MRLLFIYLINICLICSLMGCNTIERRSEFPSKKVLENVVNEFTTKKLLEKRVVKLNLEQASNFSIELAISDDRLFVVGMPNNLVALDLNGKLIWNKSFNKELVTITAGPVYYKEQLFIITSDSKLICLSAKDGKILWETILSSNSSALPVIDPDLIFVHTLDGGLTALNLQDGRQLWRVSTTVPSITLMKGSTPVVRDSYIINGFANGKLFAIDKRSGSTLWSLELSTPQGRTDLERIADISAAPVIKDGIVYAISYQGNLIAASLDSGELIWKKELSSYSGLLLASNKVYVSAIDGKLLSIDQKNGKTLWVQEQLEGRVLSKPIKFKNYIVVGDQEGYLHFIDHIDGTIKGRVMLGHGGIHITPIVKSQNQLQILTNDGYLIILEVA